MRLFIAEKPSVAMDIARALGGNIVRGNGFVEVDGDVVTWCVGHLIGQAKPEAYGSQYEKWQASTLPIVPTEWQMVANSKTKDQLKTVGALLKKAGLVVNCGDSAREGQLIVDELIDYFGYRGPAKRLWLQEMNLAAIRKGLSRMRDNNEYRKLYACALARSRADWIMGMNLTRGYTVAWQSRGNEGTLHIGRVQTPTLCLIVARDLEIENFKPQDYFVLKVSVKHQNGTFTGTWQAPKDADYLDEAGRILDRKILAAVIARVEGKEGLITACDTKPNLRSAPLPFSLGDLQKTCNKMLGLSPSQTLTIAQALYEKHKLTTYPRTDYSHLPEDEHSMSEKIVECAKSNFGSTWDFTGTPDFTIKSAAWDSSKIGDHHGIRPTTVKNYDLGQLSKTELAVYRLIVRNFLAQFYPPYRYNSTAVDVFCEGETFKATGTVETDAGWKVLFRSDGGTEKDDENQALPKMTAGDGCKLVDARADAKKTSPPPRFDGASIIDAMEKAHLFVTDPKVKARLKETGIGTPATRAATVDNLIDREYVDEVKEGKRKVYISTSKGRLLYQAVPPQLRKPDLTAYFEELLGAIERGELDLDAFMEHQVKYVTKLIDDIKSGKVASEMPRLEDCAPPERTGAKKSTPRGEGSPAKTPATNNGASQGAAKTCAKCNAPMRLRTGSKGPFWGCTSYPDCKHTEQVQDGQKSAARASQKPDDDLPI